jgi:phosphonopyruvate decarboxylase
MILVIGWRGQPGVSDEPQHIKQGRITKAQLDLLEIPNWTINKNSDLESVILTARNVLLESQAPIAFLVEKGTFTKYSLSDGATPELGMTREDAIRLIISQLGAEDLLISTTGKASREVYECRQAKGEHLREFLTVGSMGHTLSIAAGVAIASRSKRVVCLDGDGSMLMHMGSLPVTASLKLENLIHIVLNNGAHESVGGQPTIARRIDLAGISNACGYARYFRADNPRELESVLSKSVGVAGPLFIEVVCSVGSRDDLGRPKSSPVENKAAFMEFARER